LNCIKKVKDELQAQIILTVTEGFTIKLSSEVGI